MTSRRPCVLLAAVLLAVALLGHAEAARGRKSASDKQLSRVGIVFFASPKCEKCASVKPLIEALKRTYPVRVKSFSIDQATGRALYRNLEAIHAPGRFAIPLVLVGESILIGEDRIVDELEPAVRKLARSGGAPFPYLGRGSPSEPLAKTPTQCYDCDQRGRPPDVRDELKRIRSFIDRFR